MPIPSLLDELLRAHGASGHEDAVQAIVRREAAAVGAEIEMGVLGSTVAKLKGSSTGSGRRLVALFAHADQVGLVVRGADDDGLLTVAKAAALLSPDVWRQRVRVQTTASEVRGVVVGVRSESSPDWDTLRIDIGAAGADDALAIIRPGDPIVFDGPPEELGNDRILAAALDDRAGVYACLDALRRLVADPPAWDVAVVVSTQEETGSFAGARSAAERLRPEVAIIVEATYASDAPGEPAWGDVRLGGGPAILRAPVISPLVSEGLMAVAAARDIPFSIESGQESYSDADGLSDVGGGIACGMVSIPLRYMHTAGEVAQLSDIDAAAALVASYVRSLTTETSLLR